MKLKPLLLNKIKISLLFLVILLLLTIIHIVNYKSYIANIDNIRIVLSNIDYHILLLFNIDLKNMDNPLNYYISLLNITIIILSLYSIILGIKTLNDNSYVDKYIPVNPLPKKIIYKKRALASLIHVVLVNVILFLTTYFMLLVFKIPHLFSILFYIFLAILMIQVCFYSISLVLFTFIKNKVATGVISIFILSFFIILDLIHKNTGLSFLAYINPLSFFDFNKIVSNRTIGLDYLFSFLIITFFSITFSYNEYIGDTYD